MSIFFPKLCLFAFKISGIVDSHEEEGVVMFDHLAYLVKPQSIVCKFADGMTLEEDLALVDVGIWDLFHV